MLVLCLVAFGQFHQWLNESRGSALWTTGQCVLEPVVAMIHTKTKIAYCSIKVYKLGGN